VPGNVVTTWNPPISRAIALITLTFDQATMSPCSPRRRQMLIVAEAFAKSAGEGAKPRSNVLAVQQMDGKRS
jgi:hypothetical protein